jgi:CBS domain containing-hemolysin-like protein
MIALAAAIVVLVILASVLAVAETATSRTSRVRAIALREAGRRNAALLEEIQKEPPRYLNSIYLCVLFVQNGAAILVAILSERYFGDLGITLVSVAFTLAYFVLVEAMSKTFAILNSDPAALALAPVVWVLGRALALPTRLLIGTANVLLPGKGLRQGPFVSEQDIRSMAEVGREEGSIEESERRMIHSIFEFGDTVIGQVMVPRPDVVAVEAQNTLAAALDRIVEHDVSRVPVFRTDLDRIEGILYAKDALKALHQGKGDIAVASLLRSAHFVPETKKASELLREMQQRDVEALGDGRWRVDASLPMHELNELLATNFPRDRWNTVGGLMFGLLGTIPKEGQTVTLEGFRFTAEKVQGRRVTTVLVSPHAARES